MERRDIAVLPGPVTVLPAPPDARSITIGALRSLRRRAELGKLTVPAGSLRLDAARLDGRRIAGYAKLCGFTDRQGVPLTYPHMLAFPLQMAAMLAPDFPYPVVGLVHLANDIRQHARLRVGDSLSIAVRFGEALRHAKGQAFSLLSEAYRDGELVWQSSSLYLRQGVNGPAGEPVRPFPSGPQPLTISGRWRLSPSIGKRYALVSGDRNPIHTSRLGARLFGFRRPIAHGMWTLARSAAALLPDAPVGSATLDAAFRTPLFLPGTALLLSTRQQEGTRFELRDGKAERLFVQGRLSAETA